MKYVKDFMTNQYLSKLDNMNISISDIINNFYSGIRKSSKKGMSLEFSDYKQYIMGDDIRHIDWNNYAHSDKLYIKRFNEDKQTNINIFLDLSKSMDFGEENKGYYSKIIAASIAYISLKTSDSVKIYVCDENLKPNTLLFNGKNSFNSIVNFLDCIDCKGNTNLSQTIFNILKISDIKKGFCFLISDFFSEDGYEKAIKTLQHKKQKITVLHVLSPQELNPNYNDNIKLIDSETGQECNILFDNNIKQQYLKTVENFRDSIKNFCLKVGVAYKLISTDSPFLKELCKIV